MIVDKIYCRQIEDEYYYDDDIDFVGDDSESLIGVDEFYDSHCAKQEK